MGKKRKIKLNRSLFDHHMLISDWLKKPQKMRGDVYKKS